MSIASKNRSAAPDSTQSLLQKNDRIREKHIKELRRIGSEAQRSNEDLEKQIEDLQKEIKDIHAYSAVYKDNSLVRIDERRNKPTYRDLIDSNNQTQQHMGKLEVRKPPTLTNRTKDAASNDPFRVRNCLLDVDFQYKENNQTRPHLNNEQTLSVRKRLKRSSTALPIKGSSQYQSLLPGKCTSYYAIRKYYEQEKDKLLHKWSPEERRKRTVQWIINNNTLPQFSVIRRTTTSAIFRDFSKYRSDSDVSSEQLSLPTITDSQL